MTTQTMQTWAVDTSHTSAAFKVRHMMITSVRGHFEHITGTVNGDLENDFENAEIEAKIDVSTITTGDEDRDNHLKSADFFDVENHQYMTFESTGIEKTGEQEYEVTGDLTIRGTSKPVTLDVTVSEVVQDPWGNKRAALEGRGEINRKDWGLNWNQALETGGVLVGDKVKLTIESEVVLQDGE